MDPETFAMIMKHDEMLHAFRWRPSPEQDLREILGVAVLVDAGYQQCQERGTSFRAWVREHMSVSMPTAYKLLKIAQNMDRLLAMAHATPHDS